MKFSLPPSPFTKSVFYALLCSLSLAGCGATSIQQKTPAAAPSVATAKPISPLVDKGWIPLITRLQKDHPGRDYASFFVGLSPYSSAPMSVKVKELYNNAFGKKPSKVPDDGTPKPPPSSIYRGFVTTANVEKCKEYMKEHHKAFTLMEKRHGIPKETVAALLFVETKLGTYLGSENSFWSLASMASADTKAKVADGVTDIPLTKKHDVWLQSKLTEKSEWAYSELVALLSHCTVNTLNPQGMPGSVYGAIGICQFMPSNLSPYGDDGDGDGKIDLFNPPDAIVSVGKYLSGHGWKGTLSVAGQRKVVKRYNNLNKYANTILALAASIKTGTLYSAAPDAVVKKTPKKKAPAKATQKAPTKKIDKKPTASAKATPSAKKVVLPAKKLTPLKLESPPAR